MKNISGLINYILVFVLVIIIITAFSSCVPHEKLIYVQQKQKNDTIQTFVLKSRPKNTIQPFDNLYIKIISPDAATSNMFNSESQNSQVQNVNYNMISYTVNDSGFISFPYVGEIKLKDLTILQAKDTIQSALSKYISNSTIIVKFVGKSVTLVGEFNRQGEYVIYDDNVNIFTAISMAGGLTDFGDRENITIVRENSGTAQYYKVDMTDRNLLKSNFYYLKPEDIVIVPPLKQKSFGFASFPYAIILTSVTTLIALLTFINTF